MSERWLRRLRAAGLAMAAGTLVALLQSVNLLFRRGDMGLPPRPWTGLFLLELPVWYSSLLVAPLIVLVCRRFPLLPRPRLTSILGHVLLAPPICLLSVAVMTLGRMPLTPDNPDGYWLTALQYARSFGLVFLLNYVSIAAVYSAIVHARQEQRLAAALARTRLEQLTTQLEPHFLFNALHGISALMLDDVGAARTMLARLSDLLRSSLRDSGHEVPLRQELEWLADYVAVQRCRYPSLNVTVVASAAAQAILVPRFVLQPLVENSVRHALERTGRPLTVQIRAVLDGDELRLRVSDDGPGFDSLPPAGGIGLANVKERVRALHGEGRLYLRNGSAGGAEVEVVLPAIAGAAACAAS